MNTAAATLVPGILLLLATCLRPGQLFSFFIYFSIKNYFLGLEILSAFLLLISVHQPFIATSIENRIAILPVVTHNADFFR